MHYWTLPADYKTGYFYIKLCNLARRKGVAIQEIDQTVRESSAVADEHPENIAQALYLVWKGYLGEEIYDD